MVPNITKAIYMYYEFLSPQTTRADLNTVLCYGNPVGYRKFLDELAKFLTHQYGTKVSR